MCLLVLCVVLWACSLIVSCCVFVDCCLCALLLVLGCVFSVCLRLFFVLFWLVFVCVSPLENQVDAPTWCVIVFVCVCVCLFVHVCLCLGLS